MKIFVLVAALLIGHSTCAAELQLGLLPGITLRDGAVGVLRADTTLMFGGAFFSLGPYAMYEGIYPEVTDTAYGAALRLGHSSYFEMRGGYFHRGFSQTGTPSLEGNGYVGAVVFGMHLSPHLGVDCVLSGKRIESGTLDRRWIVDLLPLITLRVDL